MSEKMDAEPTPSNDIPQIKLARVQRVPPFLLVKHVPKPSENDVKREDKKKVFNCKCSVCDKSFTTIFNLHRHLRRVHKLLVLKLQPGEFKCNECNRCYTSKKNLASHFSMKHRPSEEKQKTSITCPECHLTFRQREHLRNHIANSHGVVFESKELTFSCRDNFEKWKAEIEKEDNTKYVRFCGRKKFCPTKWREYHLCHRTGFFKRKKNVTRRLKQNGSCKIGGTCPATIIVTASTVSEELQVTLWKTHFGHGPDAPLVRDAPYKRIRNKTTKKYKKKPKNKKSVNELNNQEPHLLDFEDDVELVESEVTSKDHAANHFEENNAVFVQPLCIISSFNTVAPEIIEIETGTTVSTCKIDISKIAHKTPTPTIQRNSPQKHSVPAKKHIQRTDNPEQYIGEFIDDFIVADESSTSSIVTYVVDDDADADDDDCDNEDDEHAEANRSTLLDQINELKHIVLNKNITDEEQSFTLRKLNACINLFKHN